jgi:DNA repair protein RadC
MNVSKLEHKNDGHRGRLRQRFLENGIDTLFDYEIIELLLTLGTPRKDCKFIAKEVIDKFGGLKKVLDATIKDLQQIKGIGPSNVFGIRLFQAVAERYAKEKIIKEVIILNNPKTVFEYLQKYIGRENKEHFIMFALDSRSRLISINEISIGTINSSIVHPREVFEPAIRDLAAHIIIAHNHPSGDLEPSPEDVAITNRLVEVARILNIDLVDHVIVSNDSFLSMKEQKYL